MCFAATLARSGFGVELPSVILYGKCSWIIVAGCSTPVPVAGALLVFEGFRRGAFAEHAAYNLLEPARCRAAVRGAGGNGRRVAAAFGSTVQVFFAPRLALTVSFASADHGAA